MEIDLKTYRENKETVRNLREIEDYFNFRFPDKSDGWQALTTLFYSQIALENYIKSNAQIDPNFLPAFKVSLWNFLNKISSYENSRKEK